MYPIRPNTKWLKPLVLVFVIFVCGVLYVCRNLLWEQRFEITDELGGNIFPSAILATAATNAEIMSPADSNYVGKPLSGIALRVKSPHSNSRVRVTLKESPFFAESISEFMLEKSGVEYTIYPEIVWDYEALKNNVQSTPMTFSVTMEINGKKLPVETKTLSVRSINECLLGYLDSKNKFHDSPEYAYCKALFGISGFCRAGRQAGICLMARIAEAKFQIQFHFEFKSLVQCGICATGKNI